MLYRVQTIMYNIKLEKNNKYINNIIFKKKFFFFVKIGIFSNWLSFLLNNGH